MFITAADPVTSLFGAFGKYVYDNGFNLSDIEQIMITGVGSAYIEGNLYGLPTMKADEFVADGLGARYGLNMKELMVVSMGTGTSYVKVIGDNIRHIGGISIGGGTLQGLALLLLKTKDFVKIGELAQHDQGVALKNDITRYELQMSNLKLQQENVNNSRAIINHQLVTVLGLDSSTEIVPDTSIVNESQTLLSEKEWQEHAESAGDACIFERNFRLLCDYRNCHITDYSCFPL